MNKLVYITGGGRGIGREIALKLVELGYQVSVCARTESELRETETLSNHRVRTSPLDVTNYQAVERWIQSELDHVDAIPWGLVTAAGIYGPIGPFITNSWEAWRNGIEVNLLGTACACGAFARLLSSRKASGRMVLLSGGGATKPIPNFSNYCAAKSGVVRFGETLAIELRPLGITVNSIAPGAVNTRLVDDVLEAGPENAGVTIYNRAVAQKRNPETTADRATELVAYLLSDDAQEITGRLIAALWDLWPTLHTNPDALENPDLYTLRRVVPPEETQP